ncbi:MAG TPA: TRIC cation channel family protein, partial [Brevundimonas sp.]|nr:TRIC cation channel family protein [Brevundimonas sp.]
MTPIIDPAIANPETVLGALDFAGVAVFAATGALAAARQKHDLVTFCFFGAITGVGGGTLRDLLIGAPVFWVQDWRYIAVCLLAAAAYWMLGARTWRFRALLWLDAVGLAAYGVMGAAKAASYGVAPLICVVMGVLTACFGGVV